MHIVRVLLRVAAALALTAAVAMPLVAPGGPFANVAVTPPELTISGSVQGLVQGQPGQLTLTLVNPREQSVDVRTLTARVIDATVGCTTAALTIDTWHGWLQVPAGGRAVQALPVRLALRGVDCKGATWHLRYTST